MDKTELLPCPFCGGDAETDSRRHYRAIVGGKPGTGVAVYCLKCDADMMLCREDFPGADPEDLLNILIENWNTRTPPPTPAVAKAVEGSAAINDVIAERRRQVAVEGWTIAHDDQHKNGEMAFAAAAYAVSGGTAENQRGRDDKLLAAIQFIWPRSWSWSWWKPKGRRRDLVRSAALLIAEIERLDRAAALAALRGEG